MSLLPRSCDQADVGSDIYPHGDSHMSSSSADTLGRPFELEEGAETHSLKLDDKLPHEQNRCSLSRVAHQRADGEARSSCSCNRVL